MFNTRKNFAITTSIALLMMLIFDSCEKKSPSDLSKESIIPAPVSITATGDYFNLTKRADIYVMGESEELTQIGFYLAEKLKPATGFEIEVKQTAVAPKPGNIYLTLSGNGTNPADESYELTITKKGFSFQPTLRQEFFVVSRLFARSCLQRSNFPHSRRAHG